MYNFHYFKNFSCFVFITIYITQQHFHQYMVKINVKVFFLLTVPFHFFDFTFLLIIFLFSKLYFDFFFGFFDISNPFFITLVMLGRYLPNYYYFCITVLHLLYRIFLKQVFFVMVFLLHIQILFFCFFISFQ